MKPLCSTLFFCTYCTVFVTLKVTFFTLVYTYKSKILSYNRIAESKVPEARGKVAGVTSSATKDFVTRELGKGKDEKKKELLPRNRKGNVHLLHLF